MMIQRWISPEASRSISATPHFRESLEASLNVNDIISFYVHWFADPILQRKPQSVADVGSGYGWLAIALALRSSPEMNRRIVAIDVDERRITAARQIADFVGVSDRIEWCVASLGSLPFPDQCFDTVACIEVAEHIGKSTEMIVDLGRITRSTILIATPNLLFPLINHDTRLPFCHWLPVRWRNWYAKLFGRSHLQEGNRFWSPYGLQHTLSDFKRASNFLHFDNWDHYASANAHVPNHMKTIGAQQIWYWLTSLLGGASSHLIPTCTMILKRSRSL
jgi:2-polyprenyl-3-methyl-5-hydroxy-6-metoxy-1,4-benzoquinol methylase